MKAVIPAAGLGTRFLPMTKNSPKEMLPIIDKPAIQYVVEEAARSGIDDVLIITGRGKGAIENHFDIAYELEHVLAQRNDNDKLAQIRHITDIASIFYVRQKIPQGLGHAILQAKKHVGDEVFAVLLGDDIIVAEEPCLKQMMRVHARHDATTIAVQEVAREHVSKYGILAADEVEPGVYKIERVVEKPDVSAAPSRIAVMGRYILTPEIFNCLERTGPGKNNEIQLTDALNLLLETEDVYGYAFAGKRYDLGDKFDWLRINVELALADETFGEKLRTFLAEKMR
jgi:UTP--glucose-1-phosphate uridylyltransferase